MRKHKANKCAKLKEIVTKQAKAAYASGTQAIDSKKKAIASKRRNVNKPLG